MSNLLQFPMKFHDKEEKTTKKRTKRPPYEGSTYEQACEYLSTVRNEYDGVLFRRNTRIYRISPTRIAIRYHATDIIIYSSDGSVELNTGGWETVTTKERLNAYQNKVYVFQHKYVWYVGKDNPFIDGMVI